jgi:hypothetical protein
MFVFVNTNTFMYKHKAKHNPVQSGRTAKMKEEEKKSCVARPLGSTPHAHTFQIFVRAWNAMHEAMKFPYK